MASARKQKIVVANKVTQDEHQFHSKTKGKLFQFNSSPLRSTKSPVPSHATLSAAHKATNSSARGSCFIRARKSLATAKINLLEDVNKKCTAQTALLKMELEGGSRSRASDRFSYTPCISVLNSLDEVSADVYHKALKSFKDKDWHEM